MQGGTGNLGTNSQTGDSSAATPRHPAAGYGPRRLEHPEWRGSDDGSGYPGGSNAVGVNDQNTVVDSNALIVQVGTGPANDVALNTQANVTTANALIAQFGAGNGATNTQKYGSSGVNAAIVQAGNGNVASNQQGGSSAYDVTVPGSTVNTHNLVIPIVNITIGPDKRTITDPYHFTGVSTAPAVNSSAIVAQVGNGNAASNSQYGLSSPPSPRTTLPTFTKRSCPTSGTCTAADKSIRPIMAGLPTALRLIS